MNLIEAIQAVLNWPTFKRSIVQRRSQSSKLPDMDIFTDTTSQPQEPESSEASYHGSSSSASSPPSSCSDITDDAGLQTPEGVKGQVVRVPDLFSSIMAVQPVVNPNYHKVKPEADAWITEYVFRFPLLEHIRKD